MKENLHIFTRQQYLKSHALLSCDIVGLYTCILTSRDITPEMYAQFQKHVRLVHGSIAALEKDVFEIYHAQAYTIELPTINVLHSHTDKPQAIQDDKPT